MYCISPIALLSKAASNQANATGATHAARPCGIAPSTAVSQANVISHGITSGEGPLVQGLSQGSAIMATTPGLKKFLRSSAFNTGIACIKSGRTSDLWMSSVQNYGNLTKPSSGYFSLSNA